MKRYLMTVYFKYTQRDFKGDPFGVAINNNKLEHDCKTIKEVNGLLDDLWDETVFNIKVLDRVKGQIIIDKKA